MTGVQTCALPISLYTEARSVSCAAAGHCAVVGYFKAPGYHDQPFTQTWVGPSAGPQSISVTTSAPASKVYGGTFGVAATASSGLSVAITTSGGCSGSGSGSATVTMTSGSTSCVVHYNQAGDSDRAAASEVTETVSATQVSQSISVTTSAPASKGYEIGRAHV